MGNTVRGNQLVGMGLNALAMAVPLIGAGSELGQAVLDAMAKIGKKLTPGATTPQGENEAAMQMMQKQQQAGPMMAAARPPMPGGPPPGGPTSPPPSPMPQAA